MFDRHIMTIDHPDWMVFEDILLGEEGCNFKEDKNQEGTWTCNHNHKLTKTILKKHFPEIDRKKTVEFFKFHGGYCDCEVIFNVRDSAEHQKNHPKKWEREHDFLTKKELARARRYANGGMKNV